MDPVDRMSPHGVDWLARLEGGYRLKAYLDSAGIPTVSAGVTYWPDGRRVRLGDECRDEAEARVLFGMTLGHYDQVVFAATRDDLKQNELDALVAFCYNVGDGSFRRSTLLRFVNAHVASGLIRQQLLRWTLADLDPNHPGLEQSPGLRRRRLAEFACWASGLYLTQGEVKE